MTPGVLRVRERAETLLTRLRLIDRHDKAYTRRRNTWIFAAIALGVLGVAGTIVAKESRTVGRIVPPEAVFFLIAAPLVAVCVVQAVRYHRLDLDDRKIAVALRLVTLLRADVPARNPVALNADLRAYARGATVVDRSGSLFGNNVKKFRHPWLELLVRLADGNALTITVIDRVTRRRKRKSGGGKTKYKIRVRARSDVRVSVRLAKRYRPAADVVARLAGRSVAGLSLVLAAPSADGTRVEASFRSPVVLDTAAMPDADEVLAVLQWLYAGLRPAATRAG